MYCKYAVFLKYNTVKSPIPGQSDCFIHILQSYFIWILYYIMY